MKEKKPSSSRKSSAKPSKPSDAAKKPRAAAASPAKPAAKAKSTGQEPAKTSSSALKIPSILLEGDQAAAATVSGPGQRYSLGPTPPPEHLTPAEGELPESYGTMQLFLTARDPHWLYCAWDLSGEQLRKYNALSTDRHLVLRIYRDTFVSEPISQIHLHPESRNWFVPVPQAGTKYLAELGYYTLKAEWFSIAKSGATLTPPDALAEDTSVRFATIAPDVPFSELLSLVKSAVREHVPLIEALEQLRAEGFTNLPGAKEVAAGAWTAAQDQALAQVVSMDQIRRVWIGSLEITELIRRQLEQQVSSMGVSQLGIPSSPTAGFGSVSSPFGGVERRKGFWFNVNAELIIYGATEPDATVTIGGRQIKLRPDGSFSFRFALPDGKYNLPAIATSADGDDSRSADLKFSRGTQYRGDVGKHPQDAALKPPVKEAVS